MEITSKINFLFKLLTAELVEKYWLVSQTVLAMELGMIFLYGVMLMKIETTDEAQYLFFVPFTIHNKSNKNYKLQIDTHTYEPQREKPCFYHMQTTKVQISLQSDQRLCSSLPR